jgi:hypothetical protein
VNAEQITLLAVGGAIGVYLLLLIEIAYAVIRDHRTQD